MASTFREFLQSLDQAHLEEELQMAEGTLQLIKEEIRERQDEDRRKAL